MRLVRFLILSFSCVLAGCVASLHYLQEYRPSPETPYRLHYLGVRIYNFSGQDLSESEWNLKFYSVGAAYRTLKECLGSELDERAFEKLYSLSIIIVPDKEEYGVATLKSIFIPVDGFLVDVIRHELLHPYPFFSKRSILGDPFHADPIFERCV